MPIVYPTKGAAHPDEGGDEGAEEPGDGPVLPGVDALEVEQEHGGRDEEPGAQGEAAQVALDGQALPPA